MLSHNKEVVYRMMDEGWNKRNMDIFQELLSPDCSHDLPGLPKPSIGPEAYRQQVEGFLTAFPDAQMKIGEMVAEGPHVCVMWTFSGKQTGPLGDLPASGRDVIVHGIGKCTLRDGKIAAIVSQFDHGGMISHLTHA